MDRAPSFMHLNTQAVQFSTVIQSFRIYPKEGFAISLDNYTLVKGAKNIDNS